MTFDGSFVVEMVGWAATATFVGSYFAKRAGTLVRVQMAGALMWAAYGVLVRSAPVIVANVLVVMAAAWKARAGARPEGSASAVLPFPPPAEHVPPPASRLARRARVS